jgi:hypothetical protein
MAEPEERGCLEFFLGGVMLALVLSLIVVVLVV